MTICADSRNLTTGRVSDLWLNAQKLRLKRSTCSTYSTIIEAHIKPALGDIPIKELTIKRMQALLFKKQMGTASCRPLSARTVRNISTVLNGITEYACRCGYIDNAPKCSCPGGAVKTEASTLNEKEKKALEAYLISNMDFENFGILLCLYTGIRLGEICALTWGDISKENGTVLIRRTVQRIAKSGSKESKTAVVFDSPKSQSSNRIIPMPRFLCKQAEKIRMGNECFVLTGSLKFTEPRTLQNHFKTILKKCCIPSINFHAMRHTFATDCVNAGFDPKTLSNILGHSNVAITLNTYVHPSMDNMRRLMDKLKIPV